MLVLKFGSNYFLILTISIYIASFHRVGNPAAILSLDTDMNQNIITFYEPQEVCIIHTVE